MMTSYIKPEFYIFREVSEILSKKSEYYSFDKSKTDFSEILNEENIYIFGKPGIGKTRLLRELAQYGKKIDKKGIFIDTKLNENKETIKVIENELKDQFGINNIQKCKNVFVCFDALDEVKYDNFLKTVETITSLSNTLPKIQFIASCRINYLRKHKEVFLKAKFRAAELKPFSYEKIKSFLSVNDFTSKDIERIIDLLSSRGRDLLISIPRYLELLVSYLNENDIESLDLLKKSDLMEHIIYKHLEIEDYKLGLQHRDIVRRLLDKLSLVMEIFQTNVLTKDDLLSFFDDIDSDLKYYFIDQKGYANLFDRTTLKDNVDSIEFENTEFQEYMAAKELSRICGNSRLLFDICVNSDVNEIYPSWFNALKYLTEIDPSYIKPLIKYGFQQRLGGIYDEEYFRFITSTNVIELAQNERRKIFQLIFNYHQNLPIWLDSEIAQNLALFYDKSLNKELKFYMNNRKTIAKGDYRYIRQGNVARLVGNIFKLNVFTMKEKNYWRKKLIEIFKETNNAYAHRRDALFALEKLGDKKIILLIQQYWGSADQALKNVMVSFCRSVDSNSKISIDIFIKALMIDIFGVRSAINHISKKEAVIHFFEQSIKDSRILYKVVRFESEDFPQFLLSIEKNWDKKIEKLIQIFIVRCYSEESYYEARKSSFVFELAKITKKKIKNVIFKLLPIIRKSESARRNIFFMEDLFAFLLEPQDIKNFISEISSLPNSDIAFWTILRTKKYHPENFESFYLKGKKYLKEQFDSYEQKEKEEEKQEGESVKIYSQFKSMLEPEPEKYSTGVFHFYHNNKEEIDKSVTKSELERLKDLIYGSIFEKFDPGEQNLTFEQEKEGGRTYTTHSWIQIFGDCLKVCQDLQIPVDKYKAKILNYIPFAYSEHLDTIFYLVKDINDEDIKNLISTYKNKKSDLWRFMPENFITACENYKILNGLPVLKYFVTVEDFNVYDRKKALQTCEQLRSDKTFLKEISKRYAKSEKSAENSVHEQANELLIINHRDSKAIKWRVHQIITRRFSNIPQHQGVHSVSAQEHELWDQEFAKPLLTLDRFIYIAYFDELLIESFNLLTNKEYFDYAQYIWKIVIAFYSNLKEEGSFKPLWHLENLVQQHMDIDGINWFYYQFIKVKRDYLSYLGKPKSIYDCVGIYNKIKKTNYYNISREYEFIEKTKEILNDEIRNWVENEGAYNLIVNQKIFEGKKQQYETLIQKTITSQIKYAFIKHGFLIELYRETQLIDDRKPDFLINYGFWGPILIEVKLSTNNDIGFNKDLVKQKSYERYKQYLKGFNAILGIFLVIDNKERTEKIETWGEHLKKIEAVYNKIEQTEVIGFQAAL